MPWFLSVPIPRALDGRRCRRLSPLIGLLCAVAVGFSLQPVTAGPPAAPVPVLHVRKGGESGLVVGAHRGGKWVSWEKTHGLLRAGDKLRFYSLGGFVAELAVEKPELSPASGTAYNARLRKWPRGDSRLLGLRGAKWNPLPRVPKSSAVKPAELTAAVSRFLVGKGFKSPKIALGGQVDVDLEGDGSRETVFTASNPGFTLNVSKPTKAGSFSAVFLMQGPARKRRLTMIEGNLYLKAPPDDLPLQTELSHLMDLNGDGKLEIIVEWQYYEGGGIRVYQSQRGRYTKVLDASDGA